MNASLAATHDRLQAGGAILVSRLRHLGDVVLSLPLVECLHEIYPTAPLHYLAEPHALGPLLHHPAVTRVWESPRRTADMLRLAVRLRQEKFALGVDLFANPRSALLVFASGARVRLGEDRRVRRWLYTHPRHLVPGRTALEQHLAVLEDLGLPAAVPRVPRITLTDAERQSGRSWLPSSSSRRPLVLLHVDASHPSKEWPTEHWVDFIRRLDRHGWGILVGRAPGAPRCSAALAQDGRLPQSVTLLDALPLREYLGVVSHCDAVVSVDGGILHCSVALERPTVGLFGPTDASIWFPYERFGPYRVLHLGTVEARPDPQTRREGCLAAIEPAQVERCLDEVLEHSPHRGEPA